MMPQKLIVMIMSLIGGAVGLFAPVGVVKWLLRTEPEDAGILTLFFFPVWFLIVVAGLWIGRKTRPARDRRQAGPAAIELR